MILNTAILNVWADYDFMDILMAVSRLENFYEYTHPS